MDIVIPIAFDTDYIVSDTIDEIEYEAWDVATTYAANTLVDRNYKVYKSVAGGNLGNDPETGVNADPPTWVLMGYSNYLRMFTEGVDTVTTAPSGDDIVVEMQYTQLVETLGLMNLEGLSANVMITDGVEGVVFDEDYTLVDIGVDDMWEYYYLDYSNIYDVVIQSLPPYFGATIKVTIESDGTNASIGRLVAGTSYEIGLTDYGTSVGRTRYREITRDGFGNVKINPRRSVKKASYDVIVENYRIDTVQKLFDQVEAIPTLFIGVKDVVGMTSSTNVFGIYKDFDITIPYFETSTCVIDVEGY